MHMGSPRFERAGFPSPSYSHPGLCPMRFFLARSIKADGVVRTCTGDGKIPFIHSQDVADTTTAALTSRVYAGQSLPITGPEALSYAEMTAKSTEPPSG